MPRKRKALRFDDFAPSPTFDRFWAAYPRKVNKVDARDVWEVLKPSDVMVDQMITVLAEQAKTRQWREGFIPHPTTWLNQRRWMDQDMPETAPLMSTKGHQNLAAAKEWIERRRAAANQQKTLDQ